MIEPDGPLARRILIVRIRNWQRLAGPDWPRFTPATLWAAWRDMVATCHAQCRAEGTQ